MTSAAQGPTHQESDRGAVKEFVGGYNGGYNGGAVKGLDTEITSLASVDSSRSHGGRGRGSILQTYVQPKASEMLTK